MRDVRRHAPIRQARAPRLKQRRPDGLSQVSRGGKRNRGPDVYDRDRNTDQRDRPLQWLASHMLGLIVVVLVFGVVIYGLQEDKSSGPIDLLKSIEQANLLNPPPATAARLRRREGLDWLAPKQDRLKLATTALTIRQLIHEQVQIRRNDKPFLKIKPHLRISVRLSPALRTYADIIPSFNPIKLYAPDDRSTGHRDAERSYGTVTEEIVDLLNGVLPANDKQALKTYEITEFVRDVIATDPAAPAVRIGLDSSTISGLTPDYLTASDTAITAASNVTTLVRSEQGRDDAAQLERREFRIVSAKNGDTLQAILSELGAPDWQVRAMLTAADARLPGGRLRPGQQIHIVSSPALDGSGRSLPTQFSVFDEGQTHRVTVKRSASGEFAAQDDPDQDLLIRALLGSENDDGLASLYSSIYATGLAQGLTPKQIMQLLKIHAFDTDYRKRIQPGDQLEVFYELEQTEAGELRPGELTYTALTTGGETRRYWRFRSQDGTVDFFDEDGNNNRKFLLRKPVRGPNVRLTSGYGMRRHPVLNRMKMHPAIDWAAPTGTPIIAAGRGRVREARYKGANGNYVKLIHANGYATSYSHMSRFGPGIKAGKKVRQGDVIGYIGTTGRSTGPHLHFEVSLNNRRVNPLKIQVPRARKLKGRELAEFQRERERLTRLVRSPPVRIVSK